MELKETYKQLTNVDIDEQRQIWDSRAIGYYGEYLLFCELYKGLTGQFKILMNLNVPAEDNTTTEIDLLLIHETGIYIFECKHYSGIIYGTDTDENWTQFFKTVPNNIFKNPISQNGYHLRAIKKLYPNLPVYSFIVFTSDNCTLKTANNNPNITICTIDKVINIFHNKYLSKHTHTLMSVNQIDDIFCTLSPYSPMNDKLSANGEIAPFYAWLSPTMSALETIKNDWQKEKDKQIDITNKMKSDKKKWTIAHILTIVACIIVLIIATIGFKGSYDSLKEKNTAELESERKAFNDAVNQYKSELDKFKQNFVQYDFFGNTYVDGLEDCLGVSEVKINNYSNGRVTFTALLTLKNEDYLIKLTENSKYIVVTNTGEAYQYDVFGEHLTYSESGNTLGVGYRMSGKLAQRTFTSITDKNSISAIRLTGIQLISKSTDFFIKDNLEIELYKK